MSSRKFYALQMLLMMLVAAFFAGGCGGSSVSAPSTRSPVESSDQNPTPPIISSDPTPTPAPVESPDSIPAYDAELSAAEYALSEIVIGYSNGDNSQYVTQNLTLPTKIGSVDISWASSSGAVSANGTVTRQAEDVEVTLTATASYNGQSGGSRTFVVKVIRKRTRDNSSIIAVPLAEASSGDIEITRNDSGDVTDIEGQYVSFDIRNGDDALDAVTVLREELGIRSPDKELQFGGATINDYGAKYLLSQVHDGMPVYGRRVIVSASTSDKANFLISDFISSDVLENADLSAGISKSQAEAIAKTNYSDDVVCSSLEVIYSFDDYEGSPVRAWLVSVSGTKTNGSTDSETVVIKSSDGSIIKRTSNICYATGYTELGGDVTVNVDTKVEKDGYQYMRDDTLNIEVYYGDKPGRSNKVKIEAGKVWLDRHQVSAYTNLQQIIRWWKNDVKRNSLDDKDGKVKLVTHNTFWKKEDGSIMTNNAAWYTPEEAIVACDNSSQSRFSATVSAALDVLSHEATHGVIHYGVCQDWWGAWNYALPAFLKDVPRYIDEAYADIFACIMTNDWKMGEVLYEGTGNNIDCERNIAEPFSQQSYMASNNTITESWWDDKIKQHGSNGSLWYTQNNMIYEGALFISHAAYLMGKNGLSSSELQKLWYATIYKGAYNSDSKYPDVRKNVVNTAKTLNFTADKIAIIEEAFDDVGIIDTSANTVNLSGKVTNKATGAALSGVKVTVYKAATSSTASATLRAAGNSRSLQGSLVSRLIQAVKTFLTEYFSINLKQGTYSVTFSKEGYHPYTAEVSIGTADVELNVALSADVVVGVDDVPIDEAHFPDDKFREHVKQFDTNSDGMLSVSERGQVTSMYCYNRRIASLQGIEYFPALVNLDCGENHLTSLNVSACTGLETLNCENNGLTVLDLSDCTALKTLDCNENPLTSLDVSGCTALEWLECWDNELTTLNVSGCTALELLYCDGNKLTTLDVSSCTALVSLDCRGNQLTTLNVSGCTALQYLHCSYNQLTTLDVSGCTALQYLYCSSNQLTALDVSGCTALVELYCLNNQLTSLDASSCTALQLLRCYSNQLTTLDVSGCTALNSLECYDNQLTTLDLSNCPKLNSLNVYCDSNVTVIWPSSTTSTASTFSASSSGSRTASYAPGVLAVLPAFTPPVSGTYTFTVSLDSTPPEGSTLLLLADSEDLNGSFALADPPDTVTVSADFTAGRTYIAVIVAESESESDSHNGGCNAGTVGIILFAGLLFVSRKTKR